MSDYSNPYSDSATMTSTASRAEHSSHSVDGGESFSLLILAFISGAMAAIAAAIVTFVISAVAIRLVSNEVPLQLVVPVVLSALAGLFVGIPAGIRCHRKSGENPATWARDYEPLP
ncbi:MAG: hypothetical protein KDA96_23515 [Planctomycetaceae bacterium]|nr:hypothetical protein [Planctomycetaceae bacterium]